MMPRLAILTAVVLAAILAASAPGVGVGVGVGSAGHTGPDLRVRRNGDQIVW